MHIDTIIASTWNLLLNEWSVFDECVCVQVFVYQYAVVLLLNVIRMSSSIVGNDSVFGKSDFHLFGKCNIWIEMMTGKKQQLGKHFELCT